MRFVSDRALVGLVAGLTALTSGCAPRPPRVHTELALGACAAPIPLTPGLSVRANTLSAASERKASCARGAARACVFTLEVSTRAELRAALESSSFDGVLALYAADGGEREVRCVDDLPAGDVRHARLEAALAPGTYRLVVQGASGEAGEFELFTELEPLPEPADVCAHARPLVPGETLRESTRGGRHVFGARCGGGAQGPEHVYALKLDEPSRIRLRQQSEYDGSLYLRAVCDDSDTELACNDDFQGSSRSLLTARLAPGTYYVFSDSYAREQSGDYVLGLEREPEPEPASVGALCSAVRAEPPLVAGQYEVDTLAASSVLTGSCGGSGAPEVVLPFRVQAPTLLVALLEAPELNAVLYVRRVCDDPESELACYVAPRIDRAPLASAPALMARLEPGAYVLVVDGFSPEDLGAATLHVLFNDPSD